MDNYTGICDTELMTRTTSRGNCVSLVQIESESSKNATTRPRLDIWVSEKPFLDYLRGISGPACLGDAKRYVQRCESCQKFKTAQTKAAGKMLTRITSEPFDVLCADFVGPLPRSGRGNTMLLVFHDIFSKWVELIPLRKATAAQVQKAFRERILGRVGNPRKFICDNGTQFTSRILKEYFHTIGVEIRYTAPYCPQDKPC